MPSDILKTMHYSHYRKSKHNNKKCNASIGTRPLYFWVKFFKGRISAKL